MKPQVKVSQVIMKPEEGLAKGLAKIDSILEAIDKTSKLPIQVTCDGHKAYLKTQLAHLIEFIEVCILSFADGKAGFRSDPTGMLTGRSNYSSDVMKKKFTCAHLVDQYCQEIVAENLKKKVTEDCDVSQTAVAQALGDDSPIVDIELTDGSHIKLDKINDTIGIVDVKTGKIEWFKSKYQLGKEWACALMSWLWTWGVRIKDWLADKYNQCVDWWKDDETVTS